MKYNLLGNKKRPNVFLLLLMVFVIIFYFSTSLPRAHAEFNVDNYYSNVLGGSNLVKEFTREKISNFDNNIKNNILSSGNQIDNNFTNTSNGLSTLSNRIKKSYQKGIERAGEGFINISKKFVANINGNLKILNKGVVTVTANASSAVTETFSIKVFSDSLMKTEKKTLLKDISLQVWCLMKSITSTTCKKDL